MKETLGIFVAGANGRMGKNIVKLVVSDQETRLVGASEAADSPVQGADAGLIAGTNSLSVTILPDLERSLQVAKGVIIDFSSPETTLKNLERAVQYNVPIVIGTTGFTDQQIASIREAGTKIPVIFTPNMSVGMNLVFRLLELAGQVLKDDYDIEVLEAHHRNKVDAPSGTAIRIGEILCEQTDRKYPDDIDFDRTQKREPREKSKIGMQVLRGGDIVGEHTVFFCGDGERIEIKHVANRRTTFALGAIRAAKWLVKQQPGIYKMRDVLGLG